MSFTSEQSILIFIVLVLSILLLGIVSINKRKRVAKQIIKASGTHLQFASAIYKKVAR